MAHFNFTPTSILCYDRQLPKQIERKIKVMKFISNITKQCMKIRLIHTVSGHTPLPVQPIQQEKSISEHLYELLNKPQWKIQQSNNGYITLPSQMFRSKEYHILECNHYLRQQYLFASLSQSLNVDGAHFTLDIGHSSIIIMRGHDSIIRAFFNNCSHMNARICPRNVNVAVTDKLRCPLHHWTFACSGELIAPRTAMTRTEEQRKHFALKQASLIQSHGTLFITASPGNSSNLLSLTDIQRLNEVADNIPWPNEVDLRSYRLVSKQSEVVAVNWKFICAYSMKHSAQHGSLAITVGPTFFATISADKLFVVVSQFLPVAAEETLVNRFHLVLANAETDIITTTSHIPLFSESESHYLHIKELAQNAQNEVTSDDSPVSSGSFDLFIRDMIKALQLELIKDIQRENAFRGEHEQQMSKT